MPSNGGSAEYSNLLSSLDQTSLKIDDLGERLEFQFSKKLTESEVIGHTSGEATVAAAATASVLLPALAQPNLIDELIAGLNEILQSASGLRLAAPNISLGGIGGIVNWAKNAGNLLGKSVGAIGLVAQLVFSVGQVVRNIQDLVDSYGNIINQIQQADTERAERIAALETQFGALSSQTNRISEQVNLFESGLINVEFTANQALETANEALNEVSKLEELIKKNHSETSEKLNQAKLLQEFNFDVIGERTFYTFNQIQTGKLQQATATLSKAAVDSALKDSRTNLSKVYDATVGMSAQAQGDASYRASVAAGTTIAAGTLGYLVWKNAQGINANVNGVRSAISGGFNELKNQGKKLGNMLKVGKIMDAVTLIITLHNALILSRDITGTLFSVVDNGANFVLTAFGIKGIDDEGVQTGQAVKNFLNEAGIKIFGTVGWNQLRARWAAASAIVSSASTLMWSIRDFASTTNSLVSMAAETSGKVGNALRKSGVTQDIGTYFPERVTSQTALERRLLNVQEIAQAFESITSSLVSSQQSLLEIDKNNKELKKVWDENVKVLETGNKADKEQSKGKEVTEDDAKPEGDDE